MRRSASVLSTGVRRTGVAAVVRRLVARRRVSLLLYHDPEPDTIEKHLDYLASRYTGVTLSDVVDALRNDSWDDLPDYPLVITFDDGWKDNVKSFALCRERGFPATIFACSSIIDTNRHYWWTEANRVEALKPLPTTERLAILQGGGFSLDREYPDRQALTKTDLEAVSDTIEVGAHTRFHPVLTACSDEEAWEEIHLSRTEIETITGRPCMHFAYPNGEYGDREAQMLERAGFLSARTLEVGWNTPSTDPYRLRQLGTADDASVNRLAADLAGAGLFYTPIVRRLRLRTHTTVS
jgi:peptidoglycan/xylan/chitin deacetylase (PgdA/CDA1 family)